MQLSPEETRSLLSIVKLYRTWMYGAVKEAAVGLEDGGKSFLVDRLTLVSDIQKKLEAQLGVDAYDEVDIDAEEPVAASSKASIADARVLIADDDAVTAELISHILEDIGFQNVTIAEDGQKALDAILENEHYHLIICDWRMPELTGLEVHVKAKEAEKLEDTIFILLSAVEDDVLASRAERQGVNIYATKPIDADDFEANIRGFFD